MLGSNRVYIQNKPVVKNTKNLQKGEWFLCEDARFMATALDLGPWGVILTPKIYLECLQNGLIKLRTYNKLFVEDAYREWARLCAMNFIDRPNVLVGITGTNGKTTVAQMSYEMLNKLGVKAGYIGTNGILPDVGIKSNLTTPDAFDLHLALSRFKNLGIECAAIEVSSSGLQRKRVSQLRFDIGVCTSFSQDHLDVHGNMENYWNTKMEIQDLIDGVFLVSQQVQGCLISRNVNTKYAVYDAVNNYSHPNFTGFMNNNLQAVGKVCSIMGFACNVIQSALDKNPELRVDGRMHVISKDPKVIVDYAHTPDGLAKILEMFPEEKKILVFGCGGERDKDKRKEMAKIAQELSDAVIITDDNPRTEPPELIRKELLDNCVNAIEIPEREQAIKYAIEQAKINNYTCLICGKGAETRQIYANKAYYFSDIECAKKYTDIV